MSSNQMPTNSFNNSKDLEILAIKQYRWNKILYISIGLTIIILDFFSLYFLVTRDLILDVRQILVTFMAIMIIIAMNFFAKALQEPNNTKDSSLLNYIDNRFTTTYTKIW